MEFQGRDGKAENRNNRYRRFSHEQIQGLEEAFKWNPHPDERRRRELSEELGLETLQVKFWFQNKRTLFKRQREIQLNKRLKDENDSFRIENSKLKEELRCTPCQSCGGPFCLEGNGSNEHNLRIENAQLRDRIMEVSRMLELHGYQSVLSNSAFPMVIPSPKMLVDKKGEVVSENKLAESLTAILKNKENIFELANIAMEELLVLAQAGEPLWLSNSSNHLETLNEDEYFQRFEQGIGTKSIGLRREATREKTVIFVSSNKLIEIFMDVDKWSTFFSRIVSNAMVTNVLSNGENETCDGKLVVVSAEYQFPSPLVPTRESTFLRLCRKVSESCWAIMDLSLYFLSLNCVSKCRRRPSGYVIEQLPYGFSKVICVEHVETDDSFVHDMYKTVVYTGLAFGAKRWVVTLERQFDRLKSVEEFNINIVDADAIRRRSGTINILKLAERMVVSFFASVSGSISHGWAVVSGMDIGDVKIISRENIDDNGKSSGIVLGASTSFCLTVNPKKAYDILRDEASCSKLDILINNVTVEKINQIFVGSEEENNISLLRLNDTEDSVNKEIMIIQESSFDAISSYVIYTPVLERDINSLTNGGGDPTKVHLLPSGFAIVSDESSQTPTSLLTVSFQIIMDCNQQADLSHETIAAVENLVVRSKEKIKNMILDEDNSNQRDSSPTA